MAARATLESIRAALFSDGARARFDYLLRPGGEWIVDLHDAALHTIEDGFPDVITGRIFIPPPAQAKH